jgi:poly(A) polymerase Pap1
VRARVRVCVSCACAWVNGDGDDENQVWGTGLTEAQDRKHVMPIITPVFPAQNATANVSASTKVSSA